MADINPYVHPEFSQAQALLKAHIKHFEEEFKLKGKLPRSKDWRPFRFTIRDNIIGLTVIRHQFKDNIIEVDVCITEDPDAFEGYSGTKITTIFLLSEAYLCGSTMGIRFTSDFGRKRIPIYEKIVAMADDLGVDLKHEVEGFITPKEARMLYLALTDFSSEATQKVKELAVANLVTPERVCYLVHHGIWSIEEMESVLLGSEKPEAILAASITPLNYLPYADMLLRSRAAILGGFLDRKLRLKEVVEGDKVVDLEGSARELNISFDSRFFAKVYETLEETPIPWTSKKELVVPAGTRVVVAIRAYDWPDLFNYADQELAAMRAMVASYKDGATQFFLLVPRDVSSMQNPEKYHEIREGLEALGVNLMICPELLVRLDSDAQQRLATMENMRHDLATGEASIRQATVSRPQFDYNATTMTLVSVPRDMKDGIVELPKLAEQALYDEQELKAGVNRRNVESRYLRVMDRIVFLGKLALEANHSSPSISLPWAVLDAIAAFTERYPIEQTGPIRLNSAILPYELLSSVIGTLQGLQSMNVGLPHLAELLPFLEQANRSRRSVIVVLNQHSKEGQITAIAPMEQLEIAFQGLYVQDRVIDYGDKTLVQVAEQSIWNAVNAAKVGRANAVNLNEWPHAIITQALYLFSYRELHDSELPLSINVTYTDGSKARPFPLFRLRKRTDAEMAALRQLQPKEIGMLSCRHPEMDEMIDLYWLRNIDMNMAGETLADKDEFAYQTTKEQLAIILTKGIPARMHFYQTGYPPVVVGFYRAVVEFLMQTQHSAPVLEVIPCFYNPRSGDYDKTRPWS